MKKPYMLIILISSLIGLLIGHLLGDEVEYENSIISKDKVTYKKTIRYISVYLI